MVFEMNRVSLVKTDESYEGTLKVLRPFEGKLKNRLKGLGEIVIKVNFVTANRELATTPFDTVAAFIDFIKPFYKGKIVISEEAAIGATEEGFERYGFVELAKKDPQVSVYDSAESRSERIVVESGSGKIKFSLAKIYTDSDFVVSIARAKTHDTVVVTLSIKNLIVGAIQQKLLARRGRIHQGKEIHSILTQIAKHTFPDFAIVDGVVGMQGNGPIEGEPIRAGWIVGGFDALAVDSLAAYLMGFKIDDIGYFNLMRDGGFGMLYGKDRIEIVGDSADKLIRPFKPHLTFEDQRRWK